jgi:hypothetical protein
MANSHFIKLRIEPAMRQSLAGLFGINFHERAMPIRWSGEGVGSFRFDAVSDDERVVACLSAARNLKPGQRYKLMRDATFMWLVPNVQQRILAVVEAGVADALSKELCCGRLPPKTEIRTIDLGQEIRHELELFRTIAISERSKRSPD